MEDQKPSNVQTKTLQASDKKAKERAPWKIWTDKFINRWPVVTFMTIITVYALFADDVRLLATTKPYDDIFYSITLISLICFLLELLLASLATPDYFLGFYFWLDLVATLSLVTDIAWIWDEIVGTQDVDASNADQAGSVARAGRSARIGTRASRLARVIRLIRLIRVVKLYKNAQAAMLKEQLRKEEELALIAQEEQIAAQEAMMQAKKRLSIAAAQAVGSDNGDEEIEDSLNEEVKNINLDENSRLQPDGANLPGSNRSVTSERALDSLPRKQQRSHMEELKLDINKIAEEENAPVPVVQESLVGKKLSDLTTRKVILIVLAMLLSAPFFIVTTFIQDPDGIGIGLEYVGLFEPGTVGFNYAFENYVSEMKENRKDILLISAAGVNWESGTNPNDLRSNEKEFIVKKSVSGKDLIAIVDLRANTKMEAMLSIFQTIFVCIVLASGAMVFQNQTNDLVITPIESMIEKVKAISADPLKAAAEEDAQALAIERMEEEERRKQEELGLKKKKKKKKKKDDGPMETVILEQTIVKIGALLALGFGEAGSKIIAANMEGSGEVDPMIPGNKCISIFGFCDIRNFTDSTECLEEGVMLFVNEIGAVVHGITDMFSGAPNKNIGDAFLLVWRLEQGKDYKENAQTKELEVIPNRRVSQLCDMSALAFFKIIAETRKAKKLRKYRENERLLARMPGYEVKMGNGLHIGWAIEGAIGSFYKIDASYLSPHVKMSEKLEGATKHYGVPVLISGDIKRHFSKGAEKYIRTIDVVRFQASKQVLELYTFDIDMTEVDTDFTQKQLTRKQEKLRRVKAKVNRERYRTQCFDCTIDAVSKWQTDPDLVRIRRRVTSKFLALWSKAFTAYQKGDWQGAKTYFEDANRARGQMDKPCQNMLQILKESNFQAPSGWDGIREITDI